MRPAPKRRGGERRDAGRPRGEPIIDAVLSYALEELVEVGVAGLSVERIAKRARVNKTSVYRRWPTRSALIAAALERIVVDTSHAIPDTGSLRGDLIGLMVPIGELLGTPIGQAVLRAALTESTASSIGELVARQVSFTGPALTALVDRARARAEWRDDADPRLLVFMLVGAIMHRVLLEHEQADSRWIEQLVGLALNGVTPRERAGRATRKRRGD